MNEKLVPSDARAVSLESHVKQRRERERAALVLVRRPPSYGVIDGRPHLTTWFCAHHCPFASKGGNPSLRPVQLQLAYRRHRAVASFLLRLKRAKGKRSRPRARPVRILWPIVAGPRTGFSSGPELILFPQPFHPCPSNSK
jgi:hypothetical protein